MKHIVTASATALGFCLGLALSNVTHNLSDTTQSDIDKSTSSRIDPAPSRIANIDPKDRNSVFLRLEKILQPVVDARRAHDRYWEVGYGLSKQILSTRLSAETAARDQLKALFGANANRRIATWGLFHPLHERMPFLDSASQIRIAELEANFAIGEQSEAGKKDFRVFRKILEAEFGADLAFEYALRLSPLAQQLRESTIAFTQAEFRASFEILEYLGKPDIAPVEIVKRHQILMQQIGTERAMKLRSLRDPRFELLKQFAAMQELREDRLMSVYALLAEQQDALLLAIASENGDNTDRNAAPLREIFDRYRQRLSTLIGDANTADRLLQAFLTPIQ